MRRSNEYFFMMESLLIVNGFEIFRIDGGVKIGKIKRTKSTGASVK
jgi:hypothetical protein